MLWHGLDSQAVSSLHLQAIYSDVLDIIVVPVVKIAADRASLVDKIAAVAAIETKERKKLIEIHILVDDDFLPGRVFDALQRARIKLETPHEFEKLVPHAGVLVHTERESMIGP